MNKTIPDQLAEALRNIRDVLNGQDDQETARRMCNNIAARALAPYNAARVNGETFVKVPEQAHPAEVFAAFVEQRRDAAQDERTREYWHRLLGNVRKAATL